jgi:hypothetical protein
MSEARQTLKEKKAITPLWIVALFVSLSETVLGVAVTQTQGGIQIALTVFVIIFPLLIAGLFFAILYRKPFVFYSPTEFGEQTNVRDYVEAMRDRPLVDNEIYKNIQEVVRKTIMSKEIVSELTNVVTSGSDKQVEEMVERILDSASDTAVEKIREVSFITIDAMTILRLPGSIWHEPYNPNELVVSFLYQLYLKMQPEVPPYSYGEEWILKDQETDKIFSNIGSSKIQSGDRRSLVEVGIRAGMTLQVIQPHKH